jgi:hypothetical protein
MPALLEHPTVMVWQREWNEFGILYLCPAQGQGMAQLSAGGARCWQLVESPFSAFLSAQGLLQDLAQNQQRGPTGWHLG